VVVEKGTAWAAKAKRPHPVPVVHTEEVVQLEEASLSPSLFARQLGFASLHEHATPTVGRGVEERAEVLSPRPHELRAGTETQRRIERASVPRVEPRPIVLEGEDLFAARGRGVEKPIKAGPPSPSQSAHTSIVRRSGGTRRSAPLRAALWRERRVL
jgi:hypothetical protein